VWFWIDRFASEDSLKGRSNDEHWEIEFRGSDLWNLRQAVESLEEQLEAMQAKLVIAEGMILARHWHEYEEEAVASIPARICPCRHPGEACSAPDHRTGGYPASRQEDA